MALCSGRYLCPADSCHAGFRMAMPLSAPQRFKVASKDGVQISVQKAGSGPALLLVHGSLLNGTLSWGAVLPKLAEHFTVYVMDRRGRTPSGDAKKYSIANEADDIGCVVDAIGGPVIVLAHSYGALASLEALDQMKGVSHLILYEPPVMLKPRDSAIATSLERALEAGDREELVTIFLRDQIRVPADRIGMMQSSPIWPIVLEIARRCRARLVPSMLISLPPSAWRRGRLQRPCCLAA